MVPHGDNNVGHEVCLKVGFMLYSAISIENRKFYTIRIYLCLNRWSYLFMNFWAFVSLGIPSWFYDVTYRSCVNFKYEVAYVKNGIFTDFRFVNTFCGIWSITLWKQFKIYSVRLICTTAILLRSSCMRLSTFNAACESQEYVYSGTL